MKLEEIKPTTLVVYKNLPATISQLNGEMVTVAFLHSKKNITRVVHYKELEIAKPYKASAQP